MAISPASLRRGGTTRPPSLLLYGVAGVGKTLWGTSSPNPIVLQTEDGLGLIQAPTFGLLRSFEAAMEALACLYSEPNDFKTVVIDSLDWLEPLVWQHTAQLHGQPNIEAFGYGKGFLAALDTWRSFLDGINALRDERGMGVIMIAHAEIRRFDSPETEPYDRYQPKLHARASALVQEHVDAVLFANYRVTTLKSDVGFNKKVVRGVAAAQPLHWAQMQAYMQLAGLDRDFYLAVCKDTDELYQERIHHDTEAGAGILAKAARIIAAARPPARISEDPAWWECRLCEHHAVCHAGALPERHCRSCLHATPVAHGAWQCALHQHVLTPHEQRAGCSTHLFIPDLIAAEQIDAGDDWVSYRLPDGTVWRDGVAAETDETRIVTHGACHRCGGDRYAVRPGNGPHAFGLTCIGCGHRDRWLGKTDAATQGIAA